MEAFKSKFTLEQRKATSSKIRIQFPDRLPLIVVPSNPKADPEIEKTKFLCPSDITTGKLLYEVRKHMKALQPSESIFLFCIDPSGNNFLVNSTMVLSILFERNVHDDGFMYFVYTKENTFG